MIKMKALRSFRGAGEGRVKRGREFEARDDRRASELEAHGLGYRIDAGPSLPAQNNSPEIPDNKAATTGPLGLAGGVTGAEAPAPSSPPARRPRRQKSTNSADDLLS